MKRKLFSLLLSVALCAGSLCLCCAAQADPQTEDPSLVIDQAELLSAQEAFALYTELSQISHTYNTQVALLTVPELDGDMESFILSRFSEDGYGYNDSKDGILLVVSMSPREYMLYKNGFAATAISDDQLDSISENLQEALSQGEYADAFLGYARDCRYYLDGYINGFPFPFVKNLMICLAIGIAVGLLVVFILRGQLKSVRSQGSANGYVRPDSMKITHSSDLYLYSTVTRTPKPKSQSASGSGSSRNMSGGSF